MKIKWMLALMIVAGLGFVSKPSAATDNGRAMRGWFVDETCTRERVKNGDIRPSGTECAKKCVKEGARLMFMSETDKSLLELKDPASQVQNMGYYVELTGTTDEKKVLTVLEVKKLSEQVESCKRPKLKDKGEDKK